MKAPSKPQIGEIIRFAINGLVATAVHYTAFYTLYRVLGLPSAAASNAIGAVFGIASSFLGSRYFVFPDRRGTDIGREAAKFVALYAAIAALNAAIMFVWTDLGGLSYNAGFAIAIVLQTILAFLGNRHLVFTGAQREQ
ncbi:MAG: GtrA family protein [Hyphomonadaceae bacterium]|nr:GtrA family protein [Hyphomonadaceae bacterium]